jgi:hypothetical protein
MTTVERNILSVQIPDNLDDYEIPYDTYELFVNNKCVLVDKDGCLYNRKTYNKIDVIKCEVIKNKSSHEDDTSFFGTNHKTYNYYTQMCEPRRYVKEHKQCIENIATNFKFICKKIYYNDLTDIQNSDNSMTEESQKFDASMKTAMDNILRLNEYYKNIVETQTILCHEVSEEIIDNEYIIDLSKILGIGLKMNNYYSDNDNSLIECLIKNSSIILNLCIKILVFTEPKNAHPIIFL